VTTFQPSYNTLHFFKIKIKKAIFLQKKNKEKKEKKKEIKKRVHPNRRSTLTDELITIK
jgi:ribose 1,5-bisphosphokinase PhnN